MQRGRMGGTRLTLQFVFFFAVTKMEELTQKYKLFNDTLQKGQKESGSRKLCPEEPGGRGEPSHRQ